MKSLIKELTFVQAMLTSLLLVGCSSVNTTEDRTVNDALAGVITTVEIPSDDNLDEAPSSAMIAYSPNYYSTRSNSVWISRVSVRDLAAQGVWDDAIPRNDRLDKKSTRKSQLTKRVSSRPEELKIDSQEHHAALVDNALKEVLRARKIPKGSTVRNVLTEVIAATEMADDDPGEESSPK